MRSLGLVLLASLAAVPLGCDGRETTLDGAARDGSVALDGALDAGPRDSMDGAARDGAASDAGDVDGSAADAGGAGSDGGAGDAASGGDAAVHTGTDAGADSGSGGGTDAGTDAGTDSGPPDAGSGGDCISGATGTHAVRFEWAGSGPSSTAYVRYETNQLPDTSRWRVGAYSASIGYTPQYGDTFLGDGGLELSGTVFIDVELSTVGLSSIRDVTIAIRGRSYNTTASGSFEWQTFDGTGASPYGGVYNSAPYQWYPADATTEFSPGDNGVLLRIRAGPPSGSLVVNRVEICFDAT